MVLQKCNACQEEVGAISFSVFKTKLLKTNERMTYWDMIKIITGLEVIKRQIFIKCLYSISHPINNLIHFRYPTRMLL